MNRLYVIVCALLLAAQHSPAQKPLPSNMFTKTLTNGLTVLVLEDNSVPLATIEIAVRNGAYTETPEFNGLSHLYEHMFFKANKDYRDQSAFFERIQELGISFNGTTTDEKVNYYFTLPKYNLADGLQLMSAAIQYPSFNREEMKKEDIIVNAEFQRKESNPLYLLSSTVNHHLWGDLYSRKNPIGDHDVIISATPEMMTEIKNKYYWPNNALLIIAGDVVHDEAFAQVENAFKKWQPSGFDPFEKYPIPEMKPIAQSDYQIVESPNARTPIFLFAWQGPDTRNDVHNTYVADIFSHVLEQNASKLHKALVESGLASQVIFNYLTEKYTGPISMLVIPEPSKVKECFAVVKQQLDMLDSDDYITEEQLAISKRHYEINRVREQEITTQFAHTLSYWWCSASIDYFNTYLDNLNNVTRDDIKNYVRKYIKGRPYCAGLLISPTARQAIQPESFFKP